MSITKVLTSSPLGTLYNYVWSAEEGILLAPSYANRDKLSHEWYSASNIYECLQQCESVIAAGGVYLRDADGRREDNCRCDQGAECLDGSGYDISVRANSKEGSMVFSSVRNASVATATTSSGSTPSAPSRFT